MTSWDAGRDAVLRLLVEGHLERVDVSRSQADFLLDEARRHLASAEVLADQDPSGAYALTYDGARKALTSVLAIQGLRPTSAGGHTAVRDVVEAQLAPSVPGVVRPFDRMRRRRHQLEYPSGSAPAMTPTDVRADILKAADMVTLADRLLTLLGPFA